MAYTGNIIVNNEPLLSLTIFGLGTFPAFSGDGKNIKNNGGCTAVPSEGPIPAGKYWIVDRPTGGLRSRTQAWALDTLNSFLNKPSDHNEWFALCRDDGKIDDETWVNGVKRKHFRLHPGDTSKGCITLQNREDFRRIRTALLKTVKIPVPGTGISAYGSIEVITYESACPKSA